MLGYLKTERTLRYALAGNTSSPKSALIVLHGYGQLAPYFIRKFNEIDSSYIVIAPEGPHRFYLDGASGRVGASWMTKEERLNDIHDNNIYLDKLLIQVRADYPTIEKVHLLGFSQGAATAARWANHESTKIDSLTLWATVFPPDLQKVAYNKELKLFFAIGKDDQFYPGNKATELFEYHHERGFVSYLFNGNHDIDKSTLEEIISQF
jgi:predicted esterase